MLLHLKDAFRAVGHQVLRTFVGWSLGVMIMGIYCVFILFLYQEYGTFPMLAGSIAYLIISYFSIDLWWTYRENRRLHQNNNKKF